MSAMATSRLGRQSVGGTARSQATGAVLQRQCACGQHTIAGGQCRACGSTPGSGQRGPTHAGGATPIVRDAPMPAGQPLDATTRALMEPRFGRDFSGVRVHVDGSAPKSAEAMRARAYTVGRNIVFAPGAYAPRSDTGQRLVAHELAHVVQNEFTASRCVADQAGERCRRCV